MSRTYNIGVVFIDETNRNPSDRHAGLLLSKIRAHAAKSSFPASKRRLNYKLCPKCNMSECVHTRKITQLENGLPPRGRWDPFDCFAVQQPPLAAQQILHWGKAYSLAADDLTKI
jgi:hypothetical protein